MGVEKSSAVKAQPGIIFPLALLILVLPFSAAHSAVFTTLNDPGATNTYLEGISGQEIVGAYNSYNGVTYDGSSWTPLGNDTYVAFGVDGPNVVGTYSSGVNPNSFLYNGSSFTTLSDPNASFGTTAHGISGSTIVGYYFDYNGYANGFIYDGTNYTTLNAPSAVNGTYVTGVDGNNIVGYYKDSLSNFEGFLYNGGSWATLNDPNAVYGTYITGISGTNIVGRYYDSNDKMNGFIYSGGVWTTLDDPNGVNGTYVTGISGTDIVGYYYDSNGSANGFITAVPEPSIGALLALGMLSPMILCRRRGLDFGNFSFLYRSPKTFMSQLGT